MLPHLESEQHALRTMIDLAPIGLARFDREGRFLYMNDRLCEMLGCTRQFALERTFQELTFPDDLARCLELTGRLAEGAFPRYTIEKRFVRPDGSVVWARVTVSAVRDNAGAVQFFVGSAEDVSEAVANAEAQRQAEARLRTSLDAAAVGAFIFDVRLNTLEWSHGLGRLFGDSGKRTLEEFFAAMHPDDLPQVTAAYGRSAREGVPYEDEYRVIWPDGSVHWLHVRGDVTRGADGRPSCIVGAAADITGRRRLESAVRAREAEFATLADNISQLAWMAQPDGGRTWYNRRWFEYTGQTRDQALGLGWAKAHDPDLAEEVLNSQRASFARGETWERVVRLRRHDGQYRWFLVRAIPVRDDAGTIVYWLGTNTDITDRKLVEEMLTEREARLRRALDVENIGVMFFDNQYRITAVNRAFSRISGYATNEAVGRILWEDVTATGDSRGLDGRSVEFEKAGRTAPSEEEFVRPDGGRWWGLVTENRIGPNEGVKFVLDITARKAAEAALADTLRREHSARERAEGEARLREQVLGIVAHDLRNPTHTIFMAAGVLAELPLSAAEREQQFALIRRSAMRMERLIADLLDVSRIKAGTFSVQETDVRAEAVCADVGEIFAGQAKDAGLTLTSDVEPGLPVFKADAQRLVQLLTNLVGNATKFTSRGGSIVIQARRRRSDLEFVVRDTGRGIASEDLSAVFDRFWQAERGGSGAGLGLAIAKGIAEAHGGRIEVTSTLGAGTTFTVTLPVEMRTRRDTPRRGESPPSIAAL
jgi:PAS domain S-box-containing protein